MNTQNHQTNSNADQAAEIQELRRKLALTEAQLVRAGQAYQRRRAEAEYLRKELASTERLLKAYMLDYACKDRAHRKVSRLIRELLPASVVARWLDENRDQKF